MKKNKHIEIVRSSTVSLSSMGQASCDMIQAVLEQHYERVGVTTVSNLHDLEALADKQPDLIFLGMKNIPQINRSAYEGDSKIWLSEFLDSRGLNYTGSTAAAIELDFDKPTAKHVVHTAGLKTSSYFVAEHGQYLTSEELPLAYPLFIKPPSTGGGKGVAADSVVRDFASFQTKVKAISDEFKSHSLVENYLAGREFSVGILQIIGNDDLLAMPIELIADKNDYGDRILGQQVKAADTELVVAVHDEIIKRLVTELAKDVFKALGARDYGRIDIRLDEHGIPHFLEANLVPGLADHEFISYFTHACQINNSMGYEAMILAIVELGMSRTSNVAATYI